MIKLHTLGFPRIGQQRELKFALERYWSGQINDDLLTSAGKQIRKQQWHYQHQLDMVTVGDFSYYDHVLDTSFLVGHLPLTLKSNGLTERQNYFALARGQSAVKPSVPEINPLPMTKWFNTNYHYTVSTVDTETSFGLNATRLIEQCQEAIDLGYTPKPVVLGPLTYLWLCDAKSDDIKLDMSDTLKGIYQTLLSELHVLGIEWLQIDEPILNLELPHNWIQKFQETYQFFSQSESPKLLLTTYFGELGKNVSWVTQLPVDGLHIDALANKKKLNQIINRLTPEQILSLGVVDGGNIWRTNYQEIKTLLKPIFNQLKSRLWLAPTCSLLHLPVDVDYEYRLHRNIKSWVCFAKQRLEELNDIRILLDDDTSQGKRFSMLANNSALIHERKQSLMVHRPHVKVASMNINNDMLCRTSCNVDRAQQQQEILKLPPLATTTIGSLPQTAALRTLRQQYNNRLVPFNYYEDAIKSTIVENIRKQEDIGLDVLVHGEPERSDMVEYFAELLEGFATSEHGWVQSYGSRCVRPPIIYGDVSRPYSMTVSFASFAQSLTAKPVKAILTGPVTMLNWSYVRDDQPKSITCQQIALAIRDEVNDLEEADIKIIQINEPAFTEDTPQARAHQTDAVKWAVNCFNLCVSGVTDNTQIHSYMGSPDFKQLMPQIIKLDLDVLYIENARAGTVLLSNVVASNVSNAFGLGVYDTHNPNTTTELTMRQNIASLMQSTPVEKLWINPNRGLKTNQWEETAFALRNMVAATRKVRCLIDQDQLVK